MKFQKEHAQGLNKGRNEIRNALSITLPIRLNLFTFPLTLMTYTETFP